MAPTAFQLRQACAGSVLSEDTRDDHMHLSDIASVGTEEGDTPARPRRERPPSMRREVQKVPREQRRERPSQGSMRSVDEEFERNTYAV